MTEEKLDFTGEQLTTEILEYWSLEHLHRYAIAQTIVFNKTVLDVASGEGYGSSLLARTAEKVFGVDISVKAIEHAKRKYRQSNLEFLHGSATSIPLADNSVDVVTSFETIEHLTEHSKMLEEIKRVLRAQGVLIISSPDKKFYSDIPGYNNPFHLRELYFEEFKDLLTAHFKIVSILNQKSIVGSIVSAVEPVKEEFREFVGDFNGLQYSSKIVSPLYHIAIASNGEMLMKQPLNTSICTNQAISEKYFNAFDSATRLNEKVAQLSKEMEQLSLRNELLKKQINHPLIRSLRWLRKLFR